MQTIGERLEDARKKRSVAIEQAAEATKIRAEYLASLEKDAGADIPLQTVYIRGFLKNYAKFLRIEPSRLIADFEAIRHAHTANEPSGSARAEKELIGRLERATLLLRTPRC
jgi:cytoskeletal protein RodZ